jgi:hypothetical protein
VFVHSEFLPQELYSLSQRLTAMERVKQFSSFNWILPSVPLGFLREYKIFRRKRAFPELGNVILIKFVNVSTFSIFKQFQIAFLAISLFSHFNNNSWIGCKNQRLQSRDLVFYYKIPESHQKWLQDSNDAQAFEWTDTFFY